MDKNYIYKKLLEIVDEKDIKMDEPMSKHTTLRVGGPADIFVRPKSEEEISQIIKLLISENIPYEIVGNGSNLLVRDGGIRGVVIEIANNFNEYKIEENIIHLQAGTILAVIGQATLREELAGFEFAAGIPGTVGGAMAMNAGAHGGEMKDIVTSVRLMDTDGNIFEYTNEDMKFEYRNSILSTVNHIVLGATIKLKPGKKEEIKAKMDEYKHSRQTNQPLNKPNAGSTFKRPVGLIAAKLIDEAGLKGLTLRGAQVSDKHAGFVVNLGDATAKDMLELMSIIKTVVYTKFKVMLEEEVRILGED